MSTPLTSQSNQNNNIPSPLTPSSRKQKYTHLLILDLEASIHPLISTHETTELPLLVLSTTSPSLPIIAEFHTFIHLHRNPYPHSKNRVSIPEAILDSAPTFPEAWKNVSEFLRENGVSKENSLAVTCGDWDLRSLLITELDFHHLSNENDVRGVFRKWCNIKHLFTFTGKKVDSMVRMLNVIHEPLVGRHHSGIDDCRNIATIARWLFERGCVFRVTSEGEMELDSGDLDRAEILRREEEVRKKVADEVMMGKIEEGQLDPKDMFRSEEYGEWDEDGVPMRWKNEEVLSKSAVNKRRKMWKLQTVKHERYLAWRKGRSKVEN